MARHDPKECRDIRSNIDTWDKSWRLNRNKYNEYMTFVLGDQWDRDETKLFERYNKIPLTFNKCGVLLNHILGDQRQNTPQLQIEPTESVPEQTAETRSALIKEISLSSHARVVYQTAFMQAIVGGFGAYRVGTEYANEYSFDQDIRLYSVRDPTRCYWDTSAQHENKVDSMYSGTRTKISRKMFRALYGKRIEQQIGSSNISEDSTLAFWDDDSITVIDNYARDYDNIRIYKLSNNKIVDADEYKELDKTSVDDKTFLMYQGEWVSVVDDRMSKKYKIKHKQIAGDFILDESEFPSQQSPIIFVDQNSYFNKKGEQLTRSFFQDVKDAQRYLNYLATQQAYLLKVSRYDQFMAPRKSIAAPDIQERWRDPSTQLGAIPYDETPSGNKPEQLRPPELSMAFIQQYERTLLDIQTGTGLYNAQLGNEGNEVSGKAINARSRRGSYNTFVAFDALNRSIVIAGEIINEMIPKVYDVERSMMLNTNDKINTNITLNQQMDEYGAVVQNDMKEGKFRIRLMPGASFEGQKEEAVESMMLLLQANPQLFNLIGDLLVENLPFSNNIELRNRIRTIISPEIIQAGKTGQPLPPKPPQPSPEEIQAQIKQQELQMKMQQAQVDAQQKMQEMNLKEKELQRKALETHQDMTLAWEKLEAEKQEAAAQLQETLLRYEAELKNIQSREAVAHADNLVKLLTHRTKEGQKHDRQEH